MRSIIWVLMWRLSLRVASSSRGGGGGGGGGVLAFSTTATSVTSRGTSCAAVAPLIRGPLGNLRQGSSPPSSSKHSSKRRHAGSYATQFVASTATDDQESSSSTAETINLAPERTWNVGGLQKEVSRLTVRCHKKIGKARQRLDKANEEVERLTSDPDASLEDLEKCPNVEALEVELQELQIRLTDLNKLEVLLGDVKGKGKNVILPEHVADLAIQLEIDDEPTMQDTTKVTKKEKGPRNMQSFRLPYRRFYTKNKTEIRVGKQAEDNDELTLSPEHRDSADWWMHASGCPGSHVVIRSHDQNLDNEVMLDAAALAARQSKCTGNVIKVSMTRARDIKKPPGAKAGLVQLTGQVRTITVNMKEAQERLDRLDATVLVN